MAIRVSGLASGMDTESIVTQLVSAYNVKKKYICKSTDQLSWKQECMEDIK